MEELRVAHADLASGAALAEYERSGAVLIDSPFSQAEVSPSPSSKTCLLCLPPPVCRSVV